MEGSLFDMKQRPVFRKPPHFQNLPGEDNLFVPHERQDLPQATHPTPTHIDSGERPWQIKKILRRRKVRGSRRRGKQCLVEWTPSWLTLAEAEIAEKKWNIINILQTKSSETRGGSGLQEEVKIQWEPSWVSYADWVSRKAQLE
ncbi:MAG: hypothetical protein Q9210_002640 [Variospora velana]